MINNYIPLILFSFAITSMIAQENSISSGGNATGTSGTSSFSVGQIFYMTTQNANGSLSEGVQQAFEIETLSNNDFGLTKLEAVAYPNPTINKLNLYLGDIEIKDANYDIQDIHGRLIINKVVDGKLNIVDMESFSSGTYILTVKKDNYPLKTFKIIKK